MADKRRKLLVCSDAVAETGFARVCHNVCGALHGEWDIDILAINFRGDPHNLPWRCWPAAPGGDPVGLGRFLGLLASLRPDAVLIQNDPWHVLKFLALADRYDEEAARHGIPPTPPVVALMPIDARHLKPAIARGLNRLSEAVWYTDFARQEAELGGYTGRSSVSLLGVDLDMYRPVERSAARAALNVPQEFRGRFVVGCVNSPNPRKRLDLSVRAFAEWVRGSGLDRKPDPPILYIHADVNDDRGYDLADLAQMYGVEDLLVRPDMAGAGGLAETSMKHVYSAIDVQLSTCGGEGFGLTTLEGMACGIPQIAADVAGIAEWGRGAFYAVKCSDYQTTPFSVNTLPGVIDVKGCVRALDDLYRSEVLRRTYADRGLAKAREDRFRWEKVGRVVRDALDRACGMDANAETEEEVAVA